MRSRTNTIKFLTKRGLNKKHPNDVNLWGVFDRFDYPPVVSSPVSELSPLGTQSNASLTSLVV